MFNTIETIQIIATQESKDVSFALTSSIDAPAFLVENEGIHTVYVAVGGKAAVPHETAVTNGIPVLPMQAKTIPKGAGSVHIAVITATGESKVNISTGNGA